MIRLLLPMTDVHDGRKNGNIDEYIYTYIGHSTFKVDYSVINGMNHEHIYNHSYKKDTNRAIFDFVYEEYCRYYELLKKCKYIMPSDVRMFCLDVVSGTEEEKNLCNFIKDEFSKFMKNLIDSSSEFGIDASDAKEKKQRIDIAEKMYHY